MIPRVGKVMSIIFVVLSRSGMSPTLEFEYHECAATSGILKHGRNE
jgi:hypothetical protein